MRTIRLANLNAYKLTPATQGTSSWNARATAIQEIAPDILAVYADFDPSKISGER